MKKMRLFLVTFVFLVLSMCVEAQTVRVLPVSTSNITDSAAEMLYNRLNQAVSLNGMASTDNSNKFK